MTAFDLGYLTLLAVVAVLVLNDAINGCAAALRELLEVMRKDKP